MLLLYMAENGATRSGPCSQSKAKMTRSAMTMQDSSQSARMQARVVPGIVRISQVVKVDGNSG
jgi:hypothetical protein